MDFAFPPNMQANESLNAEWKAFIHRPELLREVSCIEAPALFVYGSEDIRPSWPAEQVAALLPNARFEMLQGANHYLWLTHAAELGDLMRVHLDGLAAARPST